MSTGSFYNNSLNTSEREMKIFKCDSCYVTLYKVIFIYSSLKVYSQKLGAPVIPVFYIFNDVCLDRMEHELQEIA